jgi:hypothetical protein
MSTALQSDSNLETDDYFLLVIRNWDSKLSDFSPIDDPTTKTKVFLKYSEAENQYFSANYKNSAPPHGKDIKVELIHMRFGNPHIVRNQIYFP